MCWLSRALNRDPLPPGGPLLTGQSINVDVMPSLLRMLLFIVVIVFTQLVND